MDTVPFSPALPDLSSGETTRAFQSDTYLAFFVRDAISLIGKEGEKPIISYPYTFAVIDPRTKGALHFVTLERSIFGSNCLCVFDRGGAHINLGTCDPLFGEREFIDRAIKLVQSNFGESLHEIPPKMAKKLPRKVAKTQGESSRSGAARRIESDDLTRANDELKTISEPVIKMNTLFTVSGLLIVSLLGLFAIQPKTWTPEVAKEVTLSCMRNYPTQDQVAACFIIEYQKYKH